MGMKRSVPNMLLKFKAWIYSGLSEVKLRLQLYDCVEIEFLVKNSH